MTLPRRHWMKRIHASLLLALLMVPCSFGADSCAGAFGERDTGRHRHQGPQRRAGEEGAHRAHRGEPERGRKLYRDHRCGRAVSHRGIAAGRYRLFAERTGFLEVDKHRPRTEGRVADLERGARAQGKC